MKHWQTWDAFTDQTDGWDTTRVDNGDGVQRVTSMPGYRTERASPMSRSSLRRG